MGLSQEVSSYAKSCAHSLSGLAKSVKRIWRWLKRKEPGGLRGFDLHACTCTPAWFRTGYAVKVMSILLGNGLVNSKALWALRFRFFLIKWKLVLISELVRGDVLFLIYQHWLGLGVWDTQNMLWISRRITSCAVLYGLLTNLTFGEFLQNVREHLTRCKLLYP